jgi:hypothetical protein
MGNKGLSSLFLLIFIVLNSFLLNALFASGNTINSGLNPQADTTIESLRSNCISYQFSGKNGKDAIIGNCVLAGYPTLNFGSNPSFEALSWTYLGTVTDLRSLIYWDLTVIPMNAIVDSAFLTLFWNPASSNPGHSSMSGSNESYLRKIIDPWNEHTVTWNNQPNTDTSHQVYITQSVNTQQNYRIKITDMVQRMVVNPSTNYGLMLQLKNETYYRSLIFCSSDHPDPARHPRIDVCYSVPTSVNELKEKNGITIWQDFADETVFVKSDDNFGKEATLSIFGSDGKEVLRFNNINSNVFSFNTSGLSAGIYFIRLLNKSRFESGKFMVR